MSEPISRKGHFDWLTLGAALLSLFFALHLLLVSAFANSGWGESGITSSDIRQYWSEAGLLIAVQAGLLIRSIVLRRGGLVSLSSGDCWGG
ncbi:hypothetical protein LGT39_06045 [Demequina sp. TTPB684]|uniref:hypothetical protein n=1 Tax=unclassified Demequina TaxID=2620311 RepID=UPI001CF339D9|nr:MULTISPECIES: hypothetical protein [unclassified Demequina]MCB2412409.1 hypothetical protein [Demequina sp. TTPB684]UPU89507.1 hypothetical protein LGT36_006150 [Demequina sp. TMPB413]